MDEQTTYELSDAEKAKYKRLLLSAYEAARDFDGSETGDKALYKPLENIDSFIQHRNDGQTSTGLEQAFAAACSPNLPEDAPKTVDGLLSLAGLFYERASNANTQEDLLATLSDGGALVIPSSSVFVQTDQGSIRPAKSTNPRQFEIRTQPRLAILVRKLREAGIYTDDLIIHAGIADPNMVRPKPYMLVQIPRLDKEVAVCDLVGEITFVSTRILGPAAWKNLSKDELKARSEIYAIRFRSEDQWWNDIAGTLLGNEQAPRKKVNLSAFANKKEPLHVELIVQAAKIHHERTGKWPTQKSGEILEEPLKGQSWSAINIAIRTRRRGLDKAGMPNEVKGITSLLDWLGFTNFKHSSTKHLSVADIVQAAKAHHERTGNWPKPNSGEIIDDPLRGHTWRAIQTAIQSRNRGLDQAGLPEEVKGITTLLEWQGLTVSKDSPTKNLSVESIVKAAKVHHERTGKWPNEQSGEVLDTSFKGDTWAAVSAAIANRGRGLHQEDLPDWVRGVGSFLEWKELKVAKNSKKRHVGIDDILTAVNVYRTKNGEWPQATAKDSKVLIEEPPVLKGSTWISLNEAISRRLRGLKNADLPECVKGLASFLEWQGLNQVPEHKTPTPL